MNEVRRKKLNDAITKLDDAKNLIEEVQGEEQDTFDNMPEGLQQGDKGQRAEEILQALEEAAGQVDDIVSTLQDAAQ